MAIELDINETKPESELEGMLNNPINAIQIVKSQISSLESQINYIESGIRLTRERMAGLNYYQDVFCGGGKILYDEITGLINEKFELKCNLKLYEEIEKEYSQENLNTHKIKKMFE